MSRPKRRRADPPRPEPTGRDRWIVLGLVGLVLGAYANAFGAAFVYDDFGSIVENPNVHWRSLDLESLRAAWLHSTTRRVVANWSFGLNHWWFGLDPMPYHATNIAIHAVSSCLLYALLRHLLALTASGAGAAEQRAQRVAAALGAAIFATHPIATQAVTYVVQRMASLAALFCLASLLAYVRARSSVGRTRLGWGAACVAAWALALGSKESAATFPAVIALYEWLFHRGGDRRTAVRLVAVVAVAAAAALALMRFNYGDPFRDTFYHDFSLGERLLSQPRVLTYYASLIAWPTPSRLVLMHGFEPSRGWLVPWTTLPAVLLWGGLVVAAVRQIERRPLAVFALGWWGLALLVETSVFPLRLAHEHRLYLPLAGVAIGVAAGARVAARRQGQAVIAGGLVLVALLATGTHLRNRVWHERETVWRDVVEKSPGEGIGYANLAAVYIDDGRYDEAMAWLERGRATVSGYAGIPRGMGLVYAARGDYERAVELLQQAIRIDPLDHAGIGQIGVLLTSLDRPQEALRYFEQSTRIFEHPHVLNHHGKALFRLGRYREAIALHRRALELAPDDGYVHVALGRALAATGQRDAARRHLERAVGLEDPIGARMELASLCWLDADAAGAVGHLRAVLEQKPELEVARNNLAWMLATAADPAVRSGAEALALMGERDRAGDDAETLDTVAAAAAAAGDARLAVETGEQAATLARAAGDETLAREIEARVDQYQRGGVYVDPLSRGERGAAGEATSR